MKFQPEFKHFHSRKCISKCRLRNSVHFVSASIVFYLFELLFHLAHMLLQHVAIFQCQDIFNTLRPRQDGRHFADDIFKCIFSNENCCILIKFSLKYVRKGPIDNNPALVQIMAWRRSGDKPLSEPMMISLPTHICVARPQWVKGILDTL